MRLLDRRLGRPAASRPFALLGTLALLGACADQAPPTAPAGVPVAAAVSRALNTTGQAASTFTWLPPLGTGTADPATFDPGAAPVVEICAWTGTACGGSAVARFTTAPTGTEQALTVNAAAGRYEAAWSLMSPSFTTRRTYRVRVLRDGAELGAVSVDVVRGRWALTRTDGTLAPLMPASSVPIHFHLSAAARAAREPLATGTNYTCVLDATGRAYCMGENDRGQLGDGTARNRTVPTPVATTARFSAITTGSDHTCALTADGTAYCWGRGDEGKLGIGSVPVRQTTPAAVATELKFTQIVAGTFMTCAIAEAGAAYCWGFGGGGHLGTGDTRRIATTPAAVVGGHRFARLSAGTDHVCGVTTANALYCWGRGNNGQIGAGTRTATNPTPVAIAAGQAFRDVRAARVTTCGLTVAGAAFCWGLGNQGALGTGSLANANTPQAVAGGLTFAALARTGAQAGTHCALTGAGAAYCWGASGGGNVGDGGVGIRLAPSPVSGGHVWAVVATSQSHSCGITTSGTAYCWGSNFYGQFGEPPVTSPYRRTVPVRVLTELTLRAGSPP